MTEYEKLKLLMATKAEDNARFAAMDERKVHTKHGVAPKSLTEVAKPKVPTVIPEGTLIIKADPGMARGIEHQKQRARGERGSNSREAPPMTYAEKVRLLNKYAGSLNPAQLAKAKAFLGLK